MLQVSRWVQWLVAAVVLAGIVIALPNALPDSVRAKLPPALQQTVALGLDLQGGSSLLLEVEMDAVTKDRLESLIADMRRALRKAHIGYTDLKASANSVSVHITDPSRRDDAKTLVQGLNPTVGGGVLSGGTRAYDFADDGQGTFSLKMTDDYRRFTQQQIVDQSIEVVRRRIDELGTREPDIAKEGDDRIVVQVPGLSDLQRLIQIHRKTAKMTFQLVAESANPNTTIAPMGNEILPMLGKDPKAPKKTIVVQKRVMVAGDRLVFAKQGNDSRCGMTAVN